MPRVHRTLPMMIALGVVAALAPAAWAEPAVAEMSPGATAVEWLPLVDYESVALRVTGPDGFVFEATYGAGEAPSVSLFDARGQSLADGVYKYELRTSPWVDAATREAMAKAREDGRAGLQALPAGAPRGSVQSGFFTVAGGSVARQDVVEPAPPQAGGAKQADGPITETVISGNLTVYNALCVGFDCPASPSFSDTSILMMENNNRIKFDDTSVGSFPANDWEIEANSNASGGPSYLGINDCGSSSQGGCTSDLVFAIEAGARASALYVESDGDVGIGTSNPVVRLHATDGDTPTLRLEQDGSSGFQPQTWDVAGNETSFFVRDATNGSTLPFRIRPGANSDTLTIDSDSQVGIGTLSPSAKLEVVNNAAGNPVMVEFTNTSSAPVMSFDSAFNDWTFSAGNTFNIATGGGATEMQLSSAGDLTISGNIITSNCPAGCGPDYVFDSDYELMPLHELDAYVAENKHLPKVPPAVEMESAGINMTQLQLRLLEKVEELTLYTISQQKTIDRQDATIEQLRMSVEQLASDRND